MGGWSGGVYSRFRNWVTDKANSINPQAALFDQEDDGFAAGLNNCVTKDGLNKPSSAMDWNGQNLTGVLNFANTGTVSLASTKITISVNGNIVAGPPTSGTPMQVNGLPGALLLDLQYQTSAANGNYIRFRDSTNSSDRGYVGSGSTLFTGGAISDFGVSVPAGGALKLAYNGGTTALQISSTGVTTAVDDGGTLQTVGWRDVPENNLGNVTTYTTVLADRGKTVYVASATTATLTIAANASVAYPLGTAIAFTNRSNNPITIAINTDSMLLAGTATAGSRTLAVNGLATALKIEANLWLISGSGLS